MNIIGTTLPDFVGYAGVGLILFAFWSIQSDRLTADRLTYSLLNGIGACAILVSLYFNPNMPSILIEIAWLAISIYGIARHFIHKNQRNKR